MNLRMVSNGFRLWNIFQQITYNGWRRGMIKSDKHSSFCMTDDESICPDSVGGDSPFGSFNQLILLISFLSGHENLVLCQDKYPLADNILHSIPVYLTVC